MRRRPDKRCYCLLGRELAAQFAPFQAGEGRVDYVVVGDFRDSVSYDALNTAFRHVMAGAEIVALQKGRYFIRNNGYNLDTGAFVQLLEYASGKTARVLGKPSTDFFAMALSQLGCAITETAVVGDDVTTDIAGARALGALAVLVRSGKYSEEALRQAPAQPDHIIGSIANLPRLLRDMHSVQGSHEACNSRQA